MAIARCEQDHKKHDEANTYHDEEYIASGDQGIASSPSCFLHEFCHDTFTERSSEWAQGSRSVSMELSITMRPLYSMRKASPRVTLPISCATTLYCLAVWRTPASDEALTDTSARAPRSLKRTASAEAGSSVKFRDAPRTGGASPAATEAKQDSARVTARPPSEISWADCSEPSAARPTRQSMRRFSAARSIAGGSPATIPAIALEYSLEENSRASAQDA